MSPKTYSRAVADEVTSLHISYVRGANGEARIQGPAPSVNEFKRALVGLQISPFLFHLPLCRWCKTVKNGEFQKKLITTHLCTIYHHSSPSITISHHGERFSPLSSPLSPRNHCAGKKTPNRAPFCTICTILHNRAPFSALKNGSVHHDAPCCTTAIVHGTPSHLLCALRALCAKKLWFVP